MSVPRRYVDTLIACTSIAGAMAIFLADMAIPNQHAQPTVAQNIGSASSALLARENYLSAEGYAVAERSVRPSASRADRNVIGDTYGRH